MRLIVNHRIGYRFTQPQQRLVQLLRLTPGSHDGQSIVDWRIDVDRDARLKTGRDGFGNETAMLYVEGPVDRVGINIFGEVITDDHAGLISGTLETLPCAVYLQQTSLTRPTAAIDELAHAAAAEADPLARAHALAALVAERTSLDRVASAPELADAGETLEAGHGTANELAMLLVAAARSIALPARCVAGYRYEAAPNPAAEARHTGDDSDRRAMPHGWAELHVEGYGWIGFDPGHAMCPDDSYVRVAVGLDYRDAAPISGARIGGGIEELEHDVRAGVTQ